MSKRGKGGVKSDETPPKKTLKKNQLLDICSGITFFLHPKIEKKWKDPILENGGSLISSFDVDQDLRKVKFICEKEDFTDFYEKIFPLMQKNPQEKRNDDNFGIDDEEIPYEEEMRMNYEIHTPKYFDRSKSGILCYWDHQLLPRLYQLSFRFYLKENTKDLEKKIQDLGGIVTNVKDKNSILITSSELINNMTQETFDKLDQINHVVLIEDLQETMKIKYKYRMKKDFEILKIQEICFEKFERFRVYEQRLKDSFLDKELIIGNNIESHHSFMPKELLFYIFNFLSEKDYLNTRLLSKRFYQQNDEYWRNIIQSKLKENKWIPSSSMSRLPKDHSFKQYRKYIYPLLLDKKRENSNNLKLQLFIDMRPHNKPLPIGCSKFGGQPDLPDGMEIPDLPFVAQINFSDPIFKSSLSALELDLPSSGILYIFYFNLFGVNHKVIYYNGDMNRLKRVPADSEEINDQFELKFFERAVSPKDKVEDDEEIIEKKSEYSMFGPSPIFDHVSIWNVNTLHLLISKKKLSKSKNDPSVWEDVISMT